MNGPATLTFTNTAPFDAAQSCNLVLNVKLQNSLAVCSSGIVVNHAQVMVADNTGDMDQALWVTQVDCGTALAISKRLVTPPGSVIAGQSITFEVTITNTGSVTATDVELTDYVTPISGARIIGVRDAAGVLPLGACINGGACNLGALGVAPNNVVKINVTVELDSDTRGQTVAQQACVEASNAARGRAHRRMPRSWPTPTLVVTKRRTGRSVRDQRFWLANKWPERRKDCRHRLLRHQVQNNGPSDMPMDVAYSRTRLPTDLIAAGSPSCRSAYVQALGNPLLHRDCSLSTG